MGDESGGSSDQSEVKCEICGGNLRRNKVKCGNSKCNIVVHSRCFESAVKLLLGSNISKTNWLCKKCSMPAGSSSDKTDLNKCVRNCDADLLHKEIEILTREKELINKCLENLEYTNKLQKDRIDLIEAKTVRNSNTDKIIGMDYSSAVKNTNIGVKQNSPVLFIKSSDVKINVMNEIKNNVNPRELNISVNKTKPIKGGMLINCEDMNSLNKLKSAVINKFGNKFSVSEPKKFNPRMLIKNVNKNITHNDSIVQEICGNFENLEQDDIKIVTKIVRKYTQNIVIEVSPTTRKLIMSKGYIFVGWEKYYVDDYVRVLRCYRCQRYGHTRNDCQTSIPICCPLCTENHEQKECVAVIKKCNNCVLYNSKSKSELPTDHACYDSHCPVYKYQLGLLKSKINYGEVET